MWQLVDRFARPPLVRHLQAVAADLNRQAREVLAAGPGERRAGARDLDHLLAAGEACWHLCRELLPGKRWQQVRANLRQQARWRAELVSVCPPPPGALLALAGYARAPAEHRALRRLERRLGRLRAPAQGPRRRRAATRLLRAQAAWLGDLPPAPDARLHAGLERLYRRARQAVLGAPRSRRARRWLARLVRAEELILAVPGPTADGTAWRGIEARRRLLALIEADLWLRAMQDDASVAGLPPRHRKRVRRLLRRRRRALHGDIRVAAWLGCGETPADYRRRLPWLTFAGLVGQSGARVRNMATDNQGGRGE